ncbi:MULTISPECIES: hypothetical protein [unclassified Rhizobium]|uniref:hypothetical protein n=1 Tax=unclassified Rhizobium TaxID=2613769 RepID=UPI00117B1B53|nr:MULTISPECIES: hypothetical protein [unclassified Rhizobium]
MNPTARTNDRPSDFSGGFFARSADPGKIADRLGDKIIQQLQALPPPLRVFSNARRCNPKIL